MENKQAHILITNDDGRDAPGLLALTEALQAVGRITVIAPDRNWSVSGHAKTMHKPLRADPDVLRNGVPALITNGCPADAVALGLMGLAETPVDLVVTGINRGPNLSHDLTYSGTVTAAMEGTIAGQPAVAVSLDSRVADADYSVAAAFAASLAREVLARGLPENVLLNVNVPALPAAEIHGVQVTRMGLRIYRDELIRRVDPFGRPYYWIGGDPPIGVEEPGTDIFALAEGYISVTPLQLDFTAYEFLEALRSWAFAPPEDVT
ncbi:MAG: 5'/3'-nucleotidase SurE [Anaerolineae bacterium]